MEKLSSKARDWITTRNLYYEKLWWLPKLKYRILYYNSYPAIINNLWIFQEVKNKKTLNICYKYQHLQNSENVDKHTLNVRWNLRFKEKVMQAFENLTTNWNPNKEGVCSSSLQDESFWEEQKKDMEGSHGK